MNVDLVSSKSCREEKLPLSARVCAFVYATLNISLISPLLTPFFPARLHFKCLIFYPLLPPVPPSLSLLPKCLSPIEYAFWIIYLEMLSSAFEFNLIFLNSLFCLEFLLPLGPFSVISLSSAVFAIPPFVSSANDPNVLLPFSSRSLMKMLTKRPLALVPPLLC